MSKDKLNIVYTAKDIEQYLSGKLSHLQMHEMERAALDDPFLAEAMEGYAGMKDKDWNNQLLAVRRQIAESNAVAKVIPLHRSTGKWWKTAAAIFLIGSGALLTFILTKDRSGGKSNKQIAQTIPTTTDSVPPKDNNALPSVKTEPVSSATKEISTTATGSNTQINPAVKSSDNLAYAPGRIQSPEQVNNDKDVVADSVAIKSSVTATLSPPPLPPANNAVSPVNEPVSKSKSIARQNNVTEKREPQPDYNFIAQVVAADNSPLPFSNISIKSENFGTYADVKGNFRLVSTDTVLLIEVRSVGYLPRTFVLRKDLAQNKIVLLEDEVAIRGKTVIQKDVGSIRRPGRARLVMDSIINAEPADGWDNYNTYIANNIDIPDEVLKKGLHGEVGITFDIKANGDITNIKVDKSLGNDYDEAAKRLIEQGPQWKVKKGKKTSARVKVQF